MKISKLAFISLSILSAVACSNGGGGGKGGNKAQQLIPGVTPEGRKVNPLPADKRAGAINEMGNLAVVNKVFFKHLGVSSEQTPQHLANLSPRDLERTIENGVRNCQITPLNMNAGQPDANGNVNYSSSGKMDGPACPFMADARVAMTGHARGDQSSSSSAIRMEMDVGMSVKDAATAAAMDGIQAARIGGSIAMNISGHSTPQGAGSFDMAMDIDLKGSVVVSNGSFGVRIYGMGSQQMASDGKTSTLVVNGKNSTLIESPQYGTVLFDSITTTAPGQSPVTKFYLNGEEVAADIARQFVSEYIVY